MQKNKLHKFLLLNILILTKTLTLEIPNITGFTNIKECILRKIQCNFVLNENNISQFVLQLPHGIVVNEGGIITCDGKVLRDTETYNLDQHNILKGNIPNKKIYIDNAVVVISSPGQENWYHWLLQVLPRLKILNESGIDYDKIYINNLKYSWQKESLKIVLNKLNISDNKLLLFEDDILIQARSLIVPSVPFIPSKERNEIPFWMKKFINENFLVQTKSNLPTKIYISRSKARCRRIINEYELIEYLKTKGFVSYNLEELSVFEQAQIFNNAEIIIGPHGSGFTNLIFSKSGTVVIEIDHGLKNYQRSYYKQFAKLLSCEYTPFYTDLISEQDLEKDIFVDLEKFDAILRSIGKK